MPAVGTALLPEPSSRHPHVSRRATLHSNGLLLRGLRGPRHPWRREVLVPNRPRRSVLRGWKRRLLPSHPYSTRARTAQRARRAMTPAVAAAWTPRPWPRRSCVSRRATLPLRSGYSERAPALTRPRLALPWHTSGTTPPPPPIVPPITSFLLHARQQAADRAVDPIPGAPAPAGVPRLPPLANSATDDGAVGASSVTATRKRKGAVRTSTWPRMNASANVGQLPSSRQQGDTEAGT